VKKILAVTLAVVFVLAFAAPVFAQANMTHNAVYKMDGSIDLEKQVGHLCNTGAEMKQTIKGEGVMDKVMDVAMQRWKVTVSDQNDWVTAEDAVRNLTVTSAIELCAPPKYEATASEFVYSPKVGWQKLSERTYIPSAFEMYEVGLRERSLRSQALAAHMDNPNLQAEILAMTPAELRAYVAEHEPEIHRYTTLEYDKVSDQIWAVQVAADPGFSGNIHQNFEAAYGPYGGYIEDPEADLPAAVNFADGDNFWFFQLDEDGVRRVERGDDYLGNYFNIDQMARTSQGVVRRYIDISSPFSHAYLYEDMEVVGMAEIEEAFAMNNIPPGEEATPDWWDLF